MATSKKTTTVTPETADKATPAKPKAAARAKSSATAPTAAKKTATKPAAPQRTEAPAAPAKKVAAPKKSATSKPLDPAQRAHYVEVAAFYIAERRGFAAANPMDDWLAAEAEIDRLIATGQFNR